MARSYDERGKLREVKVWGERGAVVLERFTPSGYWLLVTLAGSPAVLGRVQLEALRDGIEEILAEVPKTRGQSQQNGDTIPLSEDGKRVMSPTCRAGTVPVFDKKEE